MLSATGREFEDWSSAYRVFERGRMDKDALFEPVISEVKDQLEPDEPVVVVIDDTLVRKRGRKVAGTAWKRDPLGPAFHTNFVWGQRYFQMSLALPESSGCSRAVSVPIDFVHTPSVKKPKAGTTDEELENYKTVKAATALPTVATQRLKALKDKAGGRHIVCSMDGGYTNKTVFRACTDDMTLIGRIRKDAHLYQKPDECRPTRGRKKYYGDDAPTPEQLRQDDTIAWQQVEAFAAGKMHTFDVKVLDKLRWKGSGDKDVRLVVIRPLAYRLSKSSKLLYRQPAYLICTDEGLALDKIVQSYVWRWEIECNFRDEKNILGVGQAQVRTENSVENLPALQVAAYSYLLLAAYNTGCKATDMPRPKWYPAKTSDRCSTQQMIGMFRTQLWGIAVRTNKRQFADKSTSNTNRSFCEFPLSSALYYARK
jgi:hypothetical protein